jgi:uncharacterized membrane protein YphA (DoxX/SURF4 family)
MRRIVLRWVAPLLLAVAGWPGLAFADQGGPDKVEHGVQADPALSDKPPPALAYALGVLLVLGVLVLICMPSRKAESYNTR